MNIMGHDSEPTATLHSEGQVLWAPTAAQISQTRIAAFMAWLIQERGRRFDDYASLWNWSVEELDEFWRAIWDFFEIAADGDPEPALGSRQMPGAKWFPNARLNYAEHIFRKATRLQPALIARSENAPVKHLSWEELAAQTGALAAWLRSVGVVPGDRVVSYMPSTPETVIAFLAAASVGAIWSSCSPEMGSTVVLDRFRQIEAKVLFAVDGYSYNGKFHDRRELVRTIVEGLPSLQQVVHLPSSMGTATPPPVWSGAISWSVAVSQATPLEFVRLPFDHPLWIVYSSGTTGLPKAIVHGHGGIVVTHLKTMALQHDLRDGDRLAFLGSPGWIVWNLLVGGLLTGASIVLYDGSPTWPDADAVWKFMGTHAVTHLGCGAAFLSNCMKSESRPRDFAGLGALRAIHSTGSPLTPEAYRWVYDCVKTNVWLASISGGTDIAGGLVACAPVLPVRSGEIQCRELGVAAYAFDQHGNSVIDAVGELVITQPMPSMPVLFWNDAGNARYRASYFETYPGIWRHGDWIRFTREGSSVIYGRSDATINRHGIRMGTAEIYRVVEALPEIKDSMVVDLEYLGRLSFMPLFVVLNAGNLLDESLKARIKEHIRVNASSRHVPNEIYEVDEIPRTLTGKKMEIPIRKLLLGAAREDAVSPDAMLNPRSLEPFVLLALQVRVPR